MPDAAEIQLETLLPIGSARMRTMPARPTLAAAALLTILWAGVAAAGTGFGVSGPATIDTRAPQLTVDNPPAHTVLQGGQSITLGWAVADDYPSTAPEANVARMWIGSLLAAELPFVPGTGSHSWTWTAPDTSSATVHLVVTSFDAFGNQTVVQSEDFTILSTATDVPLVGQAPIFSPPQPNPFNPMTLLRFSLPQDGPVTVTVHDARGFRVRTLLAGQRPAGPLELRWNGTDDDGRRQAGGAYFIRLSCRQDGELRQHVQKALLLP